MIESFPQWRDQWEQMKLASDIVSVVHVGLLLMQPIYGEDRVARIQTLMAHVLHTIYAGKIAPL